MTRGQYIMRRANNYVPLIGLASSTYWLHTAWSVPGWQTILSFVMTYIFLIWTVASIVRFLRKSAFVADLSRSLIQWWDTELVESEQRQFLNSHVPLRYGGQRETTDY